MSDVLDLPAIDPALIDPPAAAPAPLAVVPPASVATLKQTVIDSFVSIKAHCAALAAKYRGVAFDYQSPKGLADAKAARHELREEGRYAVQRLQDRLKKEANDLKKTVDAEAAQAVAPISDVEGDLHAAITAREQEIEAAKEAARVAEVARLQGLREQVDAILAPWLDRCEGIASARIAAGIEKLRELQMPEDFADVRGHWDASKTATIDAMGRLRAKTAAAEEAARLEAQRLENERIAAELARQQQEIEEARKRADAPAAPVATAAATEGKADNPEPGKLEAAPIQWSDGAAGKWATKESPPHGESLQQEQGTNSTGDRDAANVANPGFDSVGHRIEHPAAPTLHPNHGIDADDLQAKSLAFVRLVLAARAGRFPSHPKPEQSWWAEVYAAGDALLPRLAKVCGEA